MSVPVSYTHLDVYKRQDVHRLPERRRLVGHGRSELCHRGEKHDLPRG